MRRPLTSLLLLGGVLAPARAAAQGDSVRINFECPSCAGKARVGLSTAWISPRGVLQVMPASSSLSAS